MIFPWLFRKLPGPPPLKVLQLALIVAATIFILFAFVFPAVEGNFTVDPTV